MTTHAAQSVPLPSSADNPTFTLQPQLHTLPSRPIGSRLIFYITPTSHWFVHAAGKMIGVSRLWPDALTDTAQFWSDIRIGRDNLELAHLCMRWSLNALITFTTVQHPIPNSPAGCASLLSPQ